MKAILVFALCVTASQANLAIAQANDENTLETCLDKEHLEENQFAAWSEEEENRFAACLEAAEQGYTEAQYNLGQMYGHFRWRNYAEAVKWHRRAAEQRHPKAQKELDRLLYERSGSVPENYEEAVKWYTRAAEQGDAEALSGLRRIIFVPYKGVTPEASMEALKRTRELPNRQTRRRNSASLECTI